MSKCLSVAMLMHAIAKLAERAKVWVAALRVRTFTAAVLASHLGALR